MLWSTIAESLLLLAIAGHWNTVTEKYQNF